MNALKFKPDFVAFSGIYRLPQQKAQKSMISTCCFMLPNMPPASTSKGRTEGKRTDNRQESLAGSGQCNHMAVYRPQR